MGFLDLLFVGSFAGAISGPITYVVLTYAPHYGLLDRPDKHHKKHSQEIPLGGGLAVLLAVVINLSSLWFTSTLLQETLSQETSFLIGLFFASTWIVALGLVDDHAGMRGRTKLLAQLTAVLILITSGLQINAFTLFGHHVELGHFALPLTALWLLGAINSLNLLDGIDGLASTLGILLCSTITLMLFMTGQTALAIVGAAFVGSLIGFFCFNFPPASIFLGDAGSMLIGLVVGALAIGGSLKDTATVGLAAPIAIWALPIFDSLTAIARRKLTGRSIYATDRGHLHHRLMHLFGKNTYVLAAVTICCSITCSGALLSMLMKNDLFALAAVTIVLATLIMTRAFGHIEFMMLLSRIKTSTILRFAEQKRCESSLQLQGNGEWSHVWQSIVDLAEEMHVVDLKLDINLAAVQESFHASWSRPTRSEKNERWRAETPLFVEQHVVGRMVASGTRKEGVTSREAIDRLIQLLEPLETELATLTSR